MKIIKPQHLSIMQRPYRWQRQNHLAITVMALIDMGPVPRLFSEQALWQLVAEELQSPDGVLDLGLPKVCPEFLASGYAYPHDSPDKSECEASIQVGDLAKAVRVFGDRVWQDGYPATPQPFKQMPLDWQHAFGGEGDEENPFGLGVSSRIDDAQRPPLLPNIEASDRLLNHPDQRPLPVSFNAVPSTTTRRMARQGKAFDEEWLNDEYPGFARDTDWRVFNQADADQWWPDRESLPAGATWRITNMHPEKPVQQGALPGWQARCFITRLQSEGERFEEIAMRATTLHFFPHLERMAMIWHGSIVVDEDDAADIVTLMSALEHSNAPRQPARYRQILEQRSESEQAVLLALRDTDLLPEGAIGPLAEGESEQMLSPVQQNLVNREQRLRARLRQDFADSGMDIDALAPVSQRPQPVPMEDLADYIDQQEQQAQRELQQMMARYEADRQRYDHEPQRETLPSGIDNYRNQRRTFEQNAARLDVKTAKLDLTREAIFDGYRLSAHHLNAADRMTPEQSLRAREQVMALMAQGGDCRDLDLTGADLSGLDLRGADFERALLENVDFSYCQLAGSSFSRAVLTRAEFHHCSLQECIFEQTNLAQAQCYHADFSGSVLAEIECAGLMLEQCILDRVMVKEVIFSKMSIAHCRFHHAHIEQCHFTEITLQTLDFREATLVKNYFVECQLAGLSFQAARLTAVGFVTCQAEEINFQDAYLHTCLFVAASQLPRANFSRSTLVECNLRELMLHHARFIQAQLQNSDLSEADCFQADMRQMQGGHCQFIRTRFLQAALTDSNLTGANLSRSRLQGCDLRGCNLFRTDLSQSLSDEHTRFDEAWTSGMKTLPRRAPVRS